MDTRFAQHMEEHMKKLALTALLAIGLGAFAVTSQPARATDNDDVNSGGGCGFSIFCGWWYWVLPGSGGGIGGAGTCYAGDRSCLPPNAINPGQPGGDCWDNPTSDACEGNTSWSLPSQTPPGGSGGGRRPSRVR